MVHVHLGQESLARPIVERAIDLDPHHFSAGFLELVQGRFQAAVDATDQMLRLDPDNVVSLWCSAIVRVYNGQFSEALPFLAELQSRPAPWRGAARFVECCLEGNRKAALEAMTPDWTDYMWDDEYHAWNVSACLAMIGELDAAISWLQQATGPREFIN